VATVYEQQNHLADKTGKNHRQQNHPRVGLFYTLHRFRELLPITHLSSTPVLRSMSGFRQALMKRANSRVYFGVRLRISCQTQGSYPSKYQISRILWLFYISQERLHRKAHVTKPPPYSNPSYKSHPVLS